MKNTDVIHLIHERTLVPRNDVRKVLRELTLIVGNELAGHEIAPLPYLGRLIPMVHNNGAEKLRREVKFDAGAVIKKRLTRPFRRLRRVTT